MQAIRLQKKYPDVSQDEMFDLMSRFKCVRLHRGSGAINDVRAAPALSTPTSRGVLTRLPCCKPFKAAANRTIVRERLSSTSPWTLVARSNWRIGSRCVHTGIVIPCLRFLIPQRFTPSSSDSSTSSYALRHLPSPPRPERSQCKAPTRTSATPSTKMSGGSSQITSMG